MSSKLGGTAAAPVRPYSVDFHIEVQPEKGASFQKTVTRILRRSDGSAEALDGIGIAIASEIEQSWCSCTYQSHDAPIRSYDMSLDRKSVV